MSRSEIFAMVDLLMIFFGANLEELKQQNPRFSERGNRLDLFHGLEQSGCSKVVFMDIIGDFMGTTTDFFGTINWLVYQA